MDKALSGIRVVDMTHNQAGPACPGAAAAVRTITRGLFYSVLTYSRFRLAYSTIWTTRRVRGSTSTVDPFTTV